MKLHKRAKVVLKALRPKQHHVPSVNPSKPASTRFTILLRSSDPSDLSNAEDEKQTRPTGKDEQERAGAGTTKSITPASDTTTATAPAPASAPFSVLGKRSRHEMAHTAIEIHEDEQDFDMSRRMAPKDDEYLQLSEDEDSNDASVSDDSGDSDDDIDETVIEDMRKLEESFKGISQKYRLINRIGEGMHKRLLSSSTTCVLLTYPCGQAHSRPCIKPTNCPSEMRWKTVVMQCPRIQRRCHQRSERQTRAPQCRPVTAGNLEPWL